MNELEAKLKHEQEKFKTYNKDLKEAENRCTCACLCSQPFSIMRRPVCASAQHCEAQKHCCGLHVLQHLHGVHTHCFMMSQSCPGLHYHVKIFVHHITVEIKSQHAQFCMRSTHCQCCATSVESSSVLRMMVLPHGLHNQAVCVISTCCTYNTIFPVQRIFTTDHQQGLLVTMDCQALTQPILVLPKNLIRTFSTHTYTLTPRDIARVWFCETVYSYEVCLASGSRS